LKILIIQLLLNLKAGMLCPDSGSPQHAKKFPSFRNPFQGLRFYSTTTFTLFRLFVVSIFQVL